MTSQTQNALTGETREKCIKSMVIDTSFLLEEDSNSGRT